MSANIPKPSNIPLPPVMTEMLHIVFDKNIADVTMLMVMSRKDGQDKIENVLLGDEAEEIYKKLIGWDKRR